MSARVGRFAVRLASRAFLFCWYIPLEADPSFPLEEDPSLCFESAVAVVAILAEMKQRTLEKVHPVFIFVQTFTLRYCTSSVIL